MSQLFMSDGQSIGASASASILPMNIQGWFPLGLTDLISLLSKGLSSVFSSTTIWKHQLFCVHPSLWFHSYIHTWKTIALSIQTFASKAMSFLFNMLSRSLLAFIQEASAFLFHGYSGNLQWFWSPRRENLSLLPLFPLLFAMKWWDWFSWS